jgi:1-acyl-sn-glycerol-3-phosphate acyltransferase
MPQFRQFLKAFLVGLMFLAGFIAITCVFPVAALGGPRRAALFRRRVRALWYSLLARILGLKVRRSGELMATPGLMVSNHISWLDIMVLGSQYPFDFVAKQEVSTWPVVGFLARHSGTLFVRRGDTHSTRATAEDMAWRLRRGHYLVLFPEGTSSPGHEVLRFHPRLFQPALLVNAPVQAVALAYRGEARNLAPFVDDDEFLPHLWKLLAIRAIEVDVVFCATVAPNRFDRNGLARHTHSQIVAALEAQNPTQANLA